MARKKLEQHIAVFGESGSGKTVLLSSFFGGMREPALSAKRRFTLVADDPAQGTRLLQAYYRMRDDAKLPRANRYESETYKFSLNLKAPAGGASTRATQPRAVQLVWHDYPGEWLEQEVSGETETRRRVELFRSLLRSDVALLLVDGQQLLAHEGEEERYLGKLFGSLSNFLLAMKDDLLDDGKLLVQFPRIWVLGLSKADLLPDMTVTAFSELVTKVAGQHLNHLREVIQSFVAGDEALSVGEDLMLLSSAKFEPGRIDVATRVGVDGMLPLAAVLPFERHVYWAAKKELPLKVAGELLSGPVDILKILPKAGGLLQHIKLPGPAAKVTGMLATLAGSQAIQEVAAGAGDKLQEMHKDAVEKKNDLAAVLTQFRLDLERAEREDVLIRSPQ